MQQWTIFGIHRPTITYTVNQFEPRLTFKRTVNRIWFNRNFHFTFRPHRHEF